MPLCEVTVREYNCHQCNWITFIKIHPPRPAPYFTSSIVCSLCFTKEYYYCPLGLYPKEYRNLELSADKQYRLTSGDSPSSRPIRNVKHWSYIYKKNLNRILRNFNCLNFDVLSIVIDMLTGVY